MIKPAFGPPTTASIGLECPRRKRHPPHLGATPLQSVRPPGRGTHHVLHWVDGHRTDVEILTSQFRYHHQAHHRSEFSIDLDPDGQVRFSRPDGTIILDRAPTTGSPDDIPNRYPTEPGTVPSKWDGSRLRNSELTPPQKEETEPTSLWFGTHYRAPTAAARIARTLGCQSEQEGVVWVTSTPDLITITPEPAGSCLINIELTTRPRHLTTPSPASASTHSAIPPPRGTPATAELDALPTEARQGGAARRSRDGLSRSAS